MILKSSSDLLKIKEEFTNKIIVLCHGVFDIFHYGHLIYLKESKKLGDVLVVTLTSDAFVIKEKNRPIFNIQQRIEIIDSLKFVDYCYISNNSSSIDIIKTLKPNIYVKGNDVKGKELNEKENLFCEYNELKLINGNLVFIDEVPVPHSTDLIKYL